MLCKEGMEHAPAGPGRARCRRSSSLLILRLWNARALALKIGGAATPTRRKGHARGVPTVAAMSDAAKGAAAITEVDEEAYLVELQRRIQDKLEHHNASMSAARSKLESHEAFLASVLGEDPAADTSGAYGA